jgi:uncharacterized protein YqhQ
MTERSPSFDPRSLDLAVGGQAVIEGVMMRCPTAVATAVRTPGGRIVIRRRPHRSVLARLRLGKVPFVRGAVNLVETLAVGMASLMYSAEQALDDTTVAEKKATPRDRLMLAGTLLFALLLSLGLFFYLPLMLTELTGVRGGFLFNLIDGVLRLVVFLGYLLAISQLPDMRRLFQYHGAEHKTIHAFENGLALTPQNAQRFPTLHPRCGTSFLFFVMVISILVFLTLGRPETLGDRLLRLAFVPVIGGIAYEAIKLSGKHAQSRWVRPLIWPGLMLQKITTREPTLEQLEVAIAALGSVLDARAADYAEHTYLELAAQSAS